MTPLFFKCCNLVAFVLDMVLCGAGAGRNMMGLTHAYDHLGNPASPAFSIWGIIFTWEAVFVGVQFFLGSDSDSLLTKLCPWFCATQLMQGLWIPLFTNSDPSLAAQGGDIWFWSSTILIVSIVPCFLKVVAVLSSLETGSTVYWLTFGLTINAAWILMASGLALAMSARALGFVGTPLCVWSLVVLILTVCLELWITGFCGTDSLRSPPAFLLVAAWALYWIFFSLKGYPPEENDHVKRLLPLYGSSFMTFYKWCTLVLIIVFLALEVRVLSRTCKTVVTGSTTLLDPPGIQID